MHCESAPYKRTAFSVCQWRPGVEGAAAKLDEFLRGKLPLFEHDRAKVKQPRMDKDAVVPLRVSCQFMATSLHLHVAYVVLAMVWFRCM
jgi:hypothetical protein